MKNTCTNMNNNYTNRFLGGLIITLFFILIVFNLSFDIVPPKILEAREIEVDILSIDKRQIEEERKEKLDKKIKLETAVAELQEEIEFKDDIEPDVMDPSGEMLEKSAQENYQPTPLVAKKAVRVAPKVIPKKKEESNKPFIFVEQMPIFEGCDKGKKGRMSKCTTDKLLAFVYKEVVYPRLAKTTNCSGKVIAQFVIGKDGYVKDIKILREPGGGLGSEVIRILKKLPKWTPGQQQGQPVNVRYTIPVVFELN